MHDVATREATPVDAQQPHASGSEKTSSTRLPRVVVVDDNRDAADSLALLLGFLGAEVSVFYDGRSAVEAVRASCPDLLLLDLGMPDLDGYQVARLIRADPACCGLTLVALTGWGQKEDRRRTREAGFDEHLVKPVDLALLQAVLAAAGERLRA